jgi:hypothetical protein
MTDDPLDPGTDAFTQVLAELADDLAALADEPDEPPG